MGFKLCCHVSKPPVNDFNHGLQTPNEAFLHQNPKFLGQGRQFGQTNFGVL